MKTKKKLFFQIFFLKVSFFSSATPYYTLFKIHLFLFCFFFLSFFFPFAFPHLPIAKLIVHVISDHIASGVIKQTSQMEHAGKYVYRLNNKINVSVVFPNLSSTSHQHPKRFFPAFLKTHKRSQGMHTIYLMRNKDKKSFYALYIYIYIYMKHKTISYMRVSVCLFLCLCFCLSLSLSLSIYIYIYIYI